MTICKTVTLRTRAIKNGMLSLYLDYYPGVRDKETMKVRRHESLSIFIYEKPINKTQKDFNESMMKKAEAIRCRRFESIVNERYDFLDKEKMKGDFLAYFRNMLHKKNEKWKFVYTHFCIFVDYKCTFEEVTVDLCRNFGEYLLSAKKLKHQKYQRKLGKNSAAGYFSTFRGLLKIAYRDKMIRENVNDFLERIETEDIRKEYLTLEEVKRLNNTPCKFPVLKAASLFSCFTGLRISDILKLKWEDIEQLSDGGLAIRLRSQKTQTEAVLPISDEAISLCGDKNTGYIFKGMNRSMIQEPLKEWLKEAGIKKHITFHCFRHTYATLQIAVGTDIYTVSKMLTHKNVSTTQIYADLVDAKKRESANKISLT